MTTRSNLRGHPIEYSGSEWVYSDTKQSTAYQGRNCGYCGLNATREGYDGCLGTLPGTMNARCGHGMTNEAYIQFLDGSIIRGKGANIIMNTMLTSEINHPDILVDADKVRKAVRKEFEKEVEK